MGKHYSVNKGAAFIFNLIIAAVCVFSVAAYFLFPLWNVKLVYTLSKEQVKQMLDSDDAAAEEIAEELGKEGVTLSFAVTLETDTFLSSFKKTGNDLIGEIIDANVETLVQSLSAPVRSVARAAVRVAAKTAVKEALGEGAQFKDVQNVETQLNAVTDALTAENATVTSVTDAALSAMENIYAAETDGATLSEADKEKCRTEIENALNNVADEEGNIDLDAFVADILVKALKQSSGEENETPASPEPAPEHTASAPQPRVFVNCFSASAEGAESAEGSNAQTGTEELKTTIKEKINETLDEETMQKIQLAAKIVAGVILFTFFTWAWVVVKMLFKLTAANPTVKLKLPILLGWLPFLVLYVLPKAAVSLLGARFAGAALSVSTCSVVSAFAALALIVISFPYRALKKRA